MAKNRSKTAKTTKSKKNKKKKPDIADIISKAIGDLARKSTKKLIKSFEKKAGNLAATITPGNFLTNALDNTKKNQNNNDKQKTASLTEGK